MMPLNVDTWTKAHMLSIKLNQERMEDVPLTLNVSELISCYKQDV